MFVIFIYKTLFVISLLPHVIFCGSISHAMFVCQQNNIMLGDLKYLTEVKHVNLEESVCGIKWKYIHQVNNQSIDPLSTLQMMWLTCLVPN